MRKRLLPGGMVRLELVLEPDEADLILRAVERAREVRAGQVEPLEEETHSTPVAEVSQSRRRAPAFPRKRPGPRGLMAR